MITVVIVVPLAVLLAVLTFAGPLPASRPRPGRVTRSAGRPAVPPATPPAGGTRAPVLPAVERVAYDDGGILTASDPDPHREERA